MAAIVAPTVGTLTPPRVSSGKRTASAGRSRYRVIAPTSTVDETLFGTPKRTRAALQTTASDGPSSEGKKKAEDKMMLVSKDQIRLLRLRKANARHDLNPHSSTGAIVLDPNEYERLKKTALVLEDRTAEQEAERIATFEASVARKKRMAELDKARKEHEKSTDMENIARDGDEILLARAQQLLQEEEDEIKHLNELIHNARCVAVRDVQLTQKAVIEQERTEEQKRLDALMEQERLRKVAEIEEREAKQREERRRGAEVLREQIREREIARLMEAEIRDQETQQVISRMEELKLEAEEELRQRRLKRAQTAKEIHEANERLKRERKADLDREKELEAAIARFQTAKEDARRKQQEDLERSRLARESKARLIYEANAQVQDRQVERENLLQKRALEEYEREWRRKEIRQAEERKQTHEMMRKTREAQQREKIRQAAIQAARDRAEFDKLNDIHREFEAAEQQKHLQEQAARARLAAQIREQIDQRRTQRVEERREFFAEGDRLDKEREERERKLEEIRRKKLEALRETGVPAKYCADIERRLRRPKLRVSEK